MATIFDDVYRTLVEKDKELLIPVINEIFGTQYQMDEKVTLLSERLTGHEELGESNRVMDTLLLICGLAYHLECQSTEDGAMAVRMLEYDFRRAFKERTADSQGNWHLKFPKSAALYLRSHEGAPQTLKVSIEFSDATRAVYQIPAVRIQNYNQEQIFQKNLLFFIPFYLLRYEKELKKIDEDKRKLSELKKEIESLYHGLSQLNQKGTLSFEKFVDIVELFNKITEYAARETTQVKKEVIGMGGQALELSREKFYREGREEGIEQGIASVVYKFMKKENIGFDDACRHCDIDEASKSMYKKHVEKMLEKEAGSGKEKS